MTQEILELRKTLEQNPSNERAFMALDERYRALGDWRSLVELYDTYWDHAVSEESGQTGANWSGLADELVGIMRDLEDKQDKGALLVTLGDVYIHRLGMREEAMTAYQESFKVWPRDTTCLERARSIYMEDQDFERVIVLYELQSKVLRKMDRAGELARTYVEMAEVFGEHLNNQTKALEMIIDARSIDPDGPHGELLYERYREADTLPARIDELVGQAEAMEASEPRESARLLVRAARLERAKRLFDNEIAQLYVERALELDADNREAARIMAEIEKGLAQDDETIEAPAQVIEELSRQATPVEPPSEEASGSDGPLDPPSEEEYVLEEIKPDDQAATEAMFTGHIAAEDQGHTSTEAMGAEGTEPLEESEDPQQSEGEEEESEGEELDLDESSALEVSPDLDEASAAALGQPIDRRDRDDAPAPIEENGASESDVYEEQALSQHISDEDLQAAHARLEREPADLEALSALRAGLRGRGEFEELSERLTHSVKYLRRKDGEFEVMLDLAMVLWRQLEDMDRAEYYFKRLRHHDSELSQMLEFYEAYYEDKQEWRKLHVHLLGRAQQARTQSSKRGYAARLATISEHHMNSPEKAIDAWRTYLSEYPSDEAARGELRRLYTEHEKWSALVEYLREELRTAEERGEETIGERVELLREIGAIYRDRVPGGDINRINTLGSLLDLAPTDREAFEELRDLLDSNRRYSELAKLLQAQAEAAVEEGDIARGVELFTQVADLWQDRLNNSSQTLPFLQRILQIEPHHASTRERLKELYQQRRDYSSLFELLQQEMETHEGDALETHLRQMLQIAQERLNRQPELAVPILDRLLDISPEDLDLYNRLEVIYRRQESWSQLADLLERKAGLEGVDEVEMVSIYKEAAQIVDTRLEEPDRAANLWRHVLSLDEDNATAFARLRDILVEHRRFDDLFELFSSRDALGRYFDTLEEVARRSEDEQERAGIYRRMAQLAQDSLEDDKRVIASLEPLLEIGEERTQVARELIDWYRRVGDLDHEIAMHRRLLEAATDEEERFGELTRLAELEIEREQDAEALRWQLEAVAAKPSEQAAVQRAEELATHLDMIEMLLDHLDAIASTQLEGSELGRLLRERQARLSRDAIGDNARAIELYEQLRDEEPRRLEWLEALEQLYDVAAMPHERIGALKRTIEILEAKDAPRERVVSSLSKIADVQHRQLGEPEQARQSYESILEVDQDFTPAIRGLREIWAGQGEWSKVVEMLQRQFALTDLDDDKGRRALRMELARVWLMELDDPARALESYGEVLNERPRDEEAAARVEELLDVSSVAREAALMLEPLWREQEEPERLARALEARLAVSEDEYEEREILEELVPLYVEVLHDQEAAFPRALRRFELDADNQQRWDEIEQLAATLHRWEEVERLMSRWAPLDREDTRGTHDSRVGLLRRIASIRERRLEDKQGALAAWERLLDFEPRELEVIGALERLYRELGQTEPLVRVLEIKSDAVTDGAQRVGLLLEAGSLTDDLIEDKTRAVVLYQQVLDLEPTQAEAVSALERLLREQERYVDLDELLANQANLAESSERRRDFLLQQSALRTQQLDDATGAFSILRHLIAEDANDLRGVMLMVTLDRVLQARDPKEPLRLDIALELDQLYRSQQNFPKLVEIGEVRLTFTDDPFERVALLDELADLYLTRLNNETNSLERTREAIVMMPDDAARRERFERLGLALDRLGDVVAAYDEAAIEADPFVSAQLYKRSGQILRENLIEPERAIDAYERALQIQDSDADTLSALEHLYMQTERFTELSDNLRAQSTYGHDPARRARLLRRIGELEEGVLDRPVQAIEAWVELLNAPLDEEDSLAALEALERLYERQEQWVDLGEVLQRKGELLRGDQGARLRTLVKLARVFEERLEDRNEAVLVYQQMLDIDPSNPTALDALDALFVAESRWADLADILRVKLSTPLDSDAERTRLELRLAKIQADELMNVDEALDLYLAVFEREPGQPEVVSQLERFSRDISYSDRAASPLITYYRSAESWHELVDLYARLLEQEHDLEQRAEYSHRIALIQRDRLDDLDAAQRSLATAWSITPERDDWRQELVALVDVRGTWSELAQTYEDVMVKLVDPDRQRELHIDLAEIYRDRMERYADAETHFQEALNLDERDLDVYTALQQLFAMQERWQDLIDLLERRYNVFAGEPDAKDLLLRIAQITDDAIEDKAAAVDAYMRVLDVEPRDQRAPQAINRLLREQERWVDLADFLENQLAIAQEEPTRFVELATELAEIYAAHLSNPERALDLWRQILDVEPMHERTVSSLEALFEREAMMRQPVAEVLEPIYRERGAWRDLIGLLRVKADDEIDPFARVELLKEIAHISEHQLDDMGRAIETTGEIFSLTPASPEARADLNRLATQTQAWRLFVSLYDRALEESYELGDYERAQLLNEMAAAQEERLEALDEARDSYRRMLEVDPGNEAAFDALERLHVRLGDTTSLAELYQRRAEAQLDANESLVWYERLATLYEEVLDEPNEAIDVYARMLDIERDDRSSRAALERLYRSTKRFEDLADLYQRSSEQAIEPEQQIAMRFQLAQLLESELDRIDDAIEMYRSILLDDPGNRDVLRALEGLRRDLTTRDGQWGERLMQIADLLLEHYDEQDWHSIVELLEIKIAASQDPHHKLDLTGRAATLVEEHANERSELMRALELRARAWRAAPEDAGEEALARFEELAGKLGAWERAVPMILGALEDEEFGPRQARLLNATARIYRDELGDSQSALLAYEQALQVHDGDAVAMRELEGLYTQFEFFEPLVHLLRKRLDVTYDDETRVRLLQRIANLYEQTLGDQDEAIRAYEELREIEPSTRSYLDALSALYERAERDDELVGVLQAKAMLLDDASERLGTLKKLAQVQHELIGDQIGAIDTYRQILAIDEHDKPAVLALIDLYEQNENWHDLLGMLRLEREFADSEEEINRVEFRMATIMLERVDQPYEALGHLRAVATRSPEWQPPVDALTSLLDHDMVREDAYAALEELHGQNQRWDALASLYETRIGYLEDPYTRSATYIKLAALQENHLEQPRRALLTYGRAFRELPTQGNVRAELERLSESLGAWEELVAIYEDALEARIDDLHTRTQVHARLGELYIDEMENASEAIRHMEAVLEADEYNLMALELLDRLYQIEQRWDDLADILQRQIAVAPPESLAQARFRLGYLKETIAEQPHDAFDLYRQVLIEQPDHRPTIEALERLMEHEDLRADAWDLLENAYMQTESWGKLAQLLRARIAETHEADAHERAELLSRVALLERDELGNPEAAFSAFGQALLADPFNLETQDQLESLASQYNAWPPIVDLYAQIAFDEGVLDDSIRRAELAGRAAQWSHAMIEGDQERAARLFNVVLDVEPQNEEALAALEQIARQRGHVDELVDILSRRVEVVYDPAERLEMFAELGQLYELLERHDEAIDALREAAMIDPANMSVMRRLVDLYERTENWFDLVDQLDRMSQHVFDAEEQGALFARIGRETTAHLSDPMRAIDAYERAMAIDPNNVEVLKEVEPLYAETGQLDRQGEVLDRQLDLAQNDEDRVRVMVRRAQIAYEYHQDTERAIVLFQQAYQLVPTSELITSSLDELYRKEARWVDLFNLYYGQLEQASDTTRRAELAVQMAGLSHDKLDDVNTAVQYLDFALGSVPNYAPALEAKESIYEEQGDWGQVSIILGQRLESASTPTQKVDALLRRARLLRDVLGQLQDAVDDLVAVLNIEPDHEEAYAELVTLLNEMKAWEQLYEVMRFRVDSLPSEADQKTMFLDMAEIAKKMGDSQRRVEALQSAYGMDPDDLDVVGPLLDAIIAQGDFERAEPLLENVITSLTEKRRMKEVVRFYHLRGKLAEQRGLDDQALEAFEAARKIDATYVPNLLSLGKSLYKRSQWDDALKIFQTLLLHQMSITDTSEKVDMYYYLGQIRHQMGDARRAKDMFNRALGVDPEHQPSAEALAALG